MSDKPAVQKINVVLDPLTHKRLRIESIERKETMSDIINRELASRYSKEQSNEK